MEKSNIVAKIDDHIFEIPETEYNKIFDVLQMELKNKDMHWDDSPFWCILHLCNVSELDAVLNCDDDRHYWTKKIIEGKKIKRKFDLKNYIKRAFYKPAPTRKEMTAKERLSEKRQWDAFWGVE